ncbi:MAG: methyltransferase domain-containing protein [candidate division KSB1 bacterium]|nr:methyltransferase domain-containing protein [candidate division KSB1 bacterium]MDZ7346952.1 methyltransferase domain-containing protein [candidate division KSB1 bacterium]
MDILNELPQKQWEEIDDLLAFVSIYDDRKRTQAFIRLLNRYRNRIKGAVCVEAGCGFGIFSEHMARLGAERVYAVEVNPHLAALAEERLRAYPNVTVIRQDIRRFVPTEPVDVLVHELFGQLLFDEDLYALSHLRFVPKLWLPDEARLQLALLSADEWVDKVVTRRVLEKTAGALIAGLFDAPITVPSKTILRWTPDNFPRSVEWQLEENGDLLCFFLTIHHQGQEICRAGLCDNWSSVWTFRCGDRFRLEFQPEDRGTNIFFEWQN